MVSATDETHVNMSCITNAANKAAEWIHDGTTQQ